MPANAPTWTEERIELLKSHFEAGLTCREIAGEIGVSRNAVIGKLSRLNLTRDKAMIRRAPRERMPPRQNAQNRCQGSSISCSGRSMPSGARGHDEPIDDGHGCSLLELSEERCRWPISTPGAEDFYFCGNMPVEGLPYCTGHTRLAYRPGSRQRVARR